MRPTETDHDDDSAEAGETSLEKLLARIPAAADALDRIPRCSEFQRLLFGEPAAYWDPQNQVDLTTKMIAAGIQLEIEELATKVATIEQKYEVVHAAERRWRVMLRERNRFVFTNDAGDIAKLPADLVSLISSGGSIDCSVVPRKGMVEFTRGETVIARIPKTLFATLKEVLEASARGARTA